MLVSARGAAEILGEAGLGREEARRLLVAGLAGRGQRTRGALLYEEERVRELTTRPVVAADVVDELCPHGLFLGRVSRDRRIEVSAGRRELEQAVCAGWRLSPFHRVLIISRVQRFGPMPFLATLCGYVVLGAEVLDLAPAEGDSTAFTLAEPGAWFARFERGRLLAGAGRSCLIWGWPS
jgi:hypothetical protein